MPTHFHFLVFIKSEKIKEIKNAIGLLLSSYTKAINKRYARHGSLFQLHTKAKIIEDENYLLTLSTYIHQNPVRSGIVKNLEDWEHSSYRACLGLNKNNFVDLTILKEYFSSVEDFKKFSEKILSYVNDKYWV